MQKVAQEEDNPVRITDAVPAEANQPFDHRFDSEKKSRKDRERANRTKTNDAIHTIRITGRTRAGPKSLPYPVHPSPQAARLLQAALLPSLEVPPPSLVAPPRWAAVPPL
jgi:hypothetical protein